MMGTNKKVIREVSYFERSTIMARRRSGTRGFWSSTEINQLKRLFPENPTAKIAQRLGRPTDAVKKKASRMGLRKARRYMKTLGRS
jgi:hypothetical protein